MNLKQLEDDIETRIDALLTANTTMQDMLTDVVAAMHQDIVQIRLWRGISQEVAQIADHREKKK